MKLLHIADLHIGKRVGGMSMIDEQLHVITQLAAIARDEGVCGVLIAGDVFDRSIPSREALETCECLFSSLIGLDVPVFVVPGNHDSPQQLAFCSGLLASSGLHIAKAFDGSIDHYDVTADGQNVRIHLLPFVRPTDVRMAMPDRASDISSHDDAVRVALESSKLAQQATNVLVAHQFVTSGTTSPDTCDSELISVGGADNVDASAFDAFDYVALGHLHGPQHIGRETIRYAGSPLKYSFSECAHSKSATIVIIDNDKIQVQTRHLEPIHDMREIVGTYQELEAGKDAGDHLDYMRVTLLDRSLADAMAKLRVIYPNIIRLDWEPIERACHDAELKVANMEALSPLDLLDQFVEQQTGRSMTKDETAAVASCLEEAMR